MKNLIKSLIMVGMLNVLSSAFVIAHAGLSKEQVKSQAVDICYAEAQKRYGHDAILAIGKKAKVKRDTSRVKWMKSMKGAMVKMHIKPKSKRPAKYSCLVEMDESVTFFKG